MGTKDAIEKAIEEDRFDTLLPLHGLAARRRAGRRRAEAERRIPDEERARAGGRYPSAKVGVLAYLLLATSDKSPPEIAEAIGFSQSMTRNPLKELKGNKFVRPTRRRYRGADGKKRYRYYVSPWLVRQD